MEGSQLIYIDAVSMITPIGANASMTHAAARAGISAYRESSILGTSFEPLKIAPVPIPDSSLNIPDIPPARPLYQQSRSRRILGLSIAALHDVLAYCPNEPLPLFFAAPEPAPLAAIDGHFIQLLSQSAPSRINVKSSRLFATGRPGGLQALQLAFHYFSQTGASHVLIGGADSLIDLAAMGFWDSEDRVLSSGAADGFVPGEGAAFLLVSPSASQRSLGAVHLPGVASEPGHRYSDEPYRGDGMAEAFRQALQHYSGAPITTVYSSINGESLGAKEHGVAFTRNHKHLNPSLTVQHPADCFGDLGAAVGPTLIGLAIGGIRSGNIKGPAMVCCAADHETRAACTVTALTTVVN